MAMSRRLQQLRLDIKRVAYVLKHSITRRLLYVVFSIYLIVTVTVTLIHMDFEYEFTKHTTFAALKNIQAMTASAGEQTCDARNTNECYPPDGGRGTGAVPNRRRR